MDDPLFTVLEKCYNAGLSNTIDVTPEYRRVMMRDNINNSKAFNWHETPDMFLGSLRDMGYIHYIKGINHADLNGEVPNNWIDLITVLASIKPAGILFFVSWNQLKIQERANNLSRRNIIATLILAIATFAISSFKEVRDVIFGSANKQQIETLRKEVTQQNKALQQLKGQLNQQSYSRHNFHKIDNK